MPGPATCGDDPKSGGDDTIDNSLRVPGFDAKLAKRFFSEVMSLPGTGRNLKSQAEFNAAKKQVAKAVVLALFTSGQFDGDRLLWRRDQLPQLTEVEKDEIEELHLRLYGTELHSGVLPQFSCGHTTFGVGRMSLSTGWCLVLARWNFSMRMH